MADCPRFVKEGDADFVSDTAGRMEEGTTAPVCLPTTKAPRAKSAQQRCCCVVDCVQSEEVDGVVLHSFPKNAILRQKWMEACGNPWGSLRKLFVCSRHFTATDFIGTDGNVLLNPSAIPSVQLPEAVVRGDSDAESDRTASPVTVFNRSSSSSDDSDTETGQELPAHQGQHSVKMEVKENFGNASVQTSDMKDITNVEKEKRKKKKGFQLTPANKVLVKARYEAGECVQKICSDLGASKHLIYLILSERIKTKPVHKPLIMNGTKRCFKVNYLKWRHLRDGRLENIMLLWLTQSIRIGQQITAQVLHDKAASFHEELYKDKGVEFDSQWICRFSNWHAAEPLEDPSDLHAADILKKERQKKFRDTIAYISEDDIYNVDEIALLWRALPDSAMLGAKVHPKTKTLQKHRLAVVCCANASGSHRLEPLVVGEKPQRVRGDDTGGDLVPFSFVERQGSLVDEELFREWFSTIFVPQVKERQARDGVTSKVVLIVDRAPCHLGAEELAKQLAPDVIVVPLPVHVPTQLQPLRQGALEAFKRNYRLHLLERLVLEEPASAKDVLEFQRGLSLSDAGQMLSISWDDVSTADLALGWLELLGKEANCAPSYDGYDAVDTSDSAFQALLQQLPGNADLEAGDLAEWLGCDRLEPVHKLLSDFQIVAAVLKEDVEEAPKNPPPTRPTKSRKVLPKKRAGLRSAPYKIEPTEPCDF